MKNHIAALEKSLHLPQAVLQNGPRVTPAVNTETGDMLKGQLAAPEGCAGITKPENKVSYELLWPQIS